MEALNKFLATKALKYDRRGIGRTYLIAGVAHQIGCYGARVDAKDDAAVRFYESMGFERLPPDQYPQPMFLPIGSIRIDR